MTLDIRTLAEQSGMVRVANQIREAGMEPIYWSVDEREITRFARAVLEEAAKAVHTWIESDEGYFAGVEERSGAWSAIEVINSLLPSEPTK